jgi:hypothetical protein
VVSLRSEGGRRRMPRRRRRSPTSAAIIAALANDVDTVRAVPGD